RRYKSDPQRQSIFTGTRGHRESRKVEKIHEISVSPQRRIQFHGIGENLLNSKNGRRRREQQRLHSLPLTVRQSAKTCQFVRPTKCVSRRERSGSFDDLAHHRMPCLTVTTQKLADRCKSFRDPRPRVKQRSRIAERLEVYLDNLPTEFLTTPPCLH